MFYVRPLRVLLPVLLLALPLYAQQRDLTDTDRAAIRTVIERQLDALRQDDAASAFALASPEIQAKFKAPERFLTMVRTSYQPHLSTVRSCFVISQHAGGQPTQAVLLVGPDGVPVLALYPMQQQPDRSGRRLDAIWSRSTIEAVTALQAPARHPGTASGRTTNPLP